MVTNKESNSFFNFELNKEMINFIWFPRECFPWCEYSSKHDKTWAAHTTTPTLTLHPCEGHVPSLTLAQEATLAGYWKVFALCWKTKVAKVNQSRDVNDSPVQVKDLFWKSQARRIEKALKQILG